MRASAANHWVGDAHVGPALPYVIDERLLVAWDTGAPLPQIAHPAYDLVLLDCNDGLLPGNGQHHNLATFADTVGALRSAGAVAEHTQVVAVSLSCANPLGRQLHEILARVGACAPADGTLLRLPQRGRRRA